MWKFYNANVRGNNVNDCVVRAISVAEGKSWDDTYEKLSDIAQHEGVLLDDVEFVERYLDNKYSRTCHYNQTVGEFLNSHKRGIYLITMQGHITVIKNGVLYDTFDCRNRKMWCAWKVL